MPEASREKEIYTVSELSEMLEAVIGSEVFSNIRVRGEIVSKQIKNGNVYLQLIDSDAKDSPRGKPTLKVIIFRWYDAKIGEEYKEGDEVVIAGDMSYYAPFGSVSLNGKDLCLYGEGMELIRLRRLKEKLAKEGLFDPGRKRPLPARIRKIAIITSASGAAYHDIKETLARKIPVSTVLFDAVVQGAEAPASLIRALDRAYRSDCDIIIFGRGGGSKTDLACFNDEALVRKLAASPIPVISGIGHEIDTSLCDLAADVYAITPTAAADKALPDLSLILDNISVLHDKLERAFGHIIDDRALTLSAYDRILERYSPMNYLAAAKGRLDGVLARFGALYLGLLSERQGRLKDTALRLERANPLAGLGAGSALLRKNGRPVAGIAELRVGDEVELGLRDGIALASIKEVS